MPKRCTESHSTFDNGFPRVVAAGDVVDDKDPAVKQNPDLFEPLEAHLARQSRSVEVATAAPGERRQVTTPAPTKKDATKKAAPRKRAAPKKAAAKKSAAKKS